MHVTNQQKARQQTLSSPKSKYPDHIALTCLILLQDTEGSDEFSQELLSEMFRDSDGASDQDYTQTGRQKEAPAANKYTFKSGNYIFKFLFDFYLNVFFWKLEVTF